MTTYIRFFHVEIHQPSFVIIETLVTLLTPLAFTLFPPPRQHVIWARDTEPEESNLPLLCAFQDRQLWLLVPPEHGFVPPPDRTAPWNPKAAEQFLKPYRPSRMLKN